MTRCVVVVAIASSRDREQSRDQCSPTDLSNCRPTDPFLDHSLQIYRYTRVCSAHSRTFFCLLHTYAMAVAQTVHIFYSGVCVLEYWCRIMLEVDCFHMSITAKWTRAQDRGQQVIATDVPLHAVHAIDWKTHAFYTINSWLRCC